MEKTEKQFRLIGCPVVKAAVFILMLVSVAAIVVGYGLIMTCVDIGLYTENRDEAVRNALRGRGADWASRIWRLWEEDEKEAAAEYLKGTNMEAAIFKRDVIYVDDYDIIYADDYGYAYESGDVLWQSYEAAGEAVPYSTLYIDYAVTNGHMVRVFFDRTFPKEDGVRETYQNSMWLYEGRYTFCGLAAGGILVFSGCLIFLLRAAGHRNGREGIVPIQTTRLHFDVFTVLLLFALAIAENLLSELSHGIMPWEVKEILLVSFAGLLAFLWLYDLAVRLKLGQCWKSTVCYLILRALKRAAAFVGKAFLHIGREIPLVLKTLLVCIAVWIPEPMLLCGGVPTLWFLWKLLLLAAVLCVALMCKELLKASRELANGNEAYTVDTSKMFGELKEHGENLNSLGKGISRAVAERMKSEHLKTELITNVSHDIKTPLTSIINYADLLGSLPEAAASEGQDGQCVCMEREKFQEYTEVLLRQSRRLKKLLEDLVEASKATTGNLEVKLAPCEVGVLLTQAVGEYQQRMAERGLELRDSQPEAPVEILADGRRLWRVFDNLLNNICKYAQENSRVYLSLEQKGDRVNVVFRNMSQYALDITPEELEERFVRGDRSRHMDGNGLGLSIAKSLTELQNGEMKIVIDGDLFKVTLTFQALSGGNH